MSGEPLNTLWWQFEAIDTWFFRESRPFNSVGAAQLASRFPPPVRTLYGAIRTAIGEEMRVDWKQFNAGSAVYNELRAVMGDAWHYGALRLHGPYLMHHHERLFPAPLLLLQHKGNSGSGEENPKMRPFARLSPGADIVECDLGRVLLPELNPPQPGAKTLEEVWLTQAGLEKVLAGSLPDDVDVRRKETLFSQEERLGIARDYGRRANHEGLLYQTRHIRPHSGVSVGVEVSGIEPKWQPAGGAIRLGGEARLAAFTTLSHPPRRLNPHPPAANGEVTKGILLVLLTPADFDGDWVPPGFLPQEDDGCRVWRGAIGDVELTIRAAIIGKAVREGGWDLAQQQPRALRSLVPAGSCFFCQVEGEASAAVAALQHHKVGKETEVGRGELAAGYW